VKKLLEISKIDPPERLIGEEMRNLLNQTLGQMQQMGIDIQNTVTEESLPAMEEALRPEAIKNLQRDFILAEIANREALAVAEEAVETRLQEIIQQFSEKNLDREKLREIVENQLMCEKTANWLQEQATVELVPQGTLSQAVGETAEVSKTGEEE
jgi:trigger factor